MNETLTTLKTRRSIRRYRPEQVRPETLDTILEAGTYAPSGMGKQSAVMVVVQKPDTIALLSRLNAEIQGRPGTDPFYGPPRWSWSWLTARITTGCGTARWSWAI